MITLRDERDREHEPRLLWNRKDLDSAVGGFHRKASERSQPNTQLFHWKIRPPLARKHKGVCNRRSRHGINDSKTQRFATCFQEHHEQDGHRQNTSQQDPKCESSAPPVRARWFLVHRNQISSPPHKIESLPPNPHPLCHTAT